MMNENNQKSNKIKEIKMLEKAFAPEDGYQLNKVFVTTFTFSIAMLGEILVRMQAFGKRIQLPEEDHDIGLRLLLAEELDLENDPRLFIAAHHFRDNIPASESDICNKFSANFYKCLWANRKRYVYEVKTDNEFQYFHPKILLIELKNNIDIAKKKYRLIISSKNLVRDSYYQLGVYMEGKFVDNQEKEDAESTGGQLSIFINKLKEKLFPEENDASLQTGKNYLNALAKEVPSISFFVPDSENLDISLKFSYPNSNNRNNLLSELKKDFISTDQKWLFFTDALQTDFPDILSSRNGPDVCMVGNQERWQTAFNNTIKIPCYAYVVNKEPSPKLHCKMLASQKRDGSIVLWVGSANCTKNAFTNNWEASVRIAFIKRNSKDLIPSLFNKAEVKKNACNTDEDDEKSLTCNIPESIPTRKFKPTDAVKQNIMEEVEERLKNTKIHGVHKNGFDYTLSIEKLNFHGIEDIENCRLFAQPLFVEKMTEFYEFENNGDIVYKTASEVSFKKAVEFQILLIVSLKIKGQTNNNIIVIVKSIIGGDNDLNKKLEKNLTEAKKTETLYKNLIPTLRSVIPLATTTDKKLYSTQDTAAIRLAKYLSIDEDSIKDSVKIEKIMKNIDKVMETLSKYNPEQDFEESDIQQKNVHGQITKTRKEFKSFRSMLEEWSV